MAAPAIVRVAANLMPVKSLRDYAMVGDLKEWRFNVIYGVKDFAPGELTLSLEQFSERYLKPQMVALAGQIDESIAAELSWRTYPLVAHG